MSSGELDLQLSSWAYLCEGKHNLVVSYRGEQQSLAGLALRIVKHPKSYDSADEELLFTREVMAKLLGEANVLVGERVMLPAEFVSGLLARDAPIRPARRVAADVADLASEARHVPAQLVPDCTSFDGLQQRARDHATITVELKPKCGFLPQSPFIQPAHVVKKEVCRFCMHQHHKLADGSIESLSGYCPIELFCGDVARVSDVVAALCCNPQNNLRVFANYGDGPKALDPQDAVQLSAPLRSFYGISPDQHAAVGDAELLLSFVNLLADIAAVRCRPLLERIRRVQHLDCLDIECAHQAFVLLQRRREAEMGPDSVDADRALYTDEWIVGLISRFLACAETHATPAECSVDCELLALSEAGRQTLTPLLRLSGGSGDSAEGIDFASRCQHHKWYKAGRAVLDSVDGAAPDRPAASLVAAQHAPVVASGEAFSEHLAGLPAGHVEHKVADDGPADLVHGDMVDILNQLSDVDLAAIVRAFLIAHTAKDLSMMITVHKMEPGESSAALPSSVQVIEHSCCDDRAQHQFAFRAVVIDTDAKPWSRVPYYHNQDREIVEHFLQCSQTKQLVLFLPEMVDCRDRTAEFLATVDGFRQRQNSKAGHASSSSALVVAPQRPISRSHFAEATKHISVGIQDTAAKLESLGKLAKQTSLFNDPAEEIQQLTYVIKHDISTLEAEIEVLQNWIVDTASQHSNTEGKHSQNIVTNLRSKLANATKSFTEALQVRARNLKSQSSRRKEFSSSKRLQRRKPRALLGDLVDEEVQSQEHRLQQEQQVALLEEEEESKDHYLASRAQAVENIEATIQQLAQMYQKLATIVQQQEEQCIRIDMEAETILTNVQDGHKELTLLLDNMSSNRGLILKIFAILILFAIFFTVFVA